MSRIGNRKIEVPSSVTVTNENGIVTVKGPKGELSLELNSNIAITQNENVLEVTDMPELVDLIVTERLDAHLPGQELNVRFAGDEDSYTGAGEGDFAGRLIESCNLKGYKVGGAEISDKHANFIINKNNATGKDIHDLITYIHDEVYKKTNVDLQIEQEYIDWE